jgi:hypothetical protein
MKDKVLQRITLQIQRLWATPITNASEAHFRAEELTRLEKLKTKYDEKSR